VEFTEGELKEKYLSMPSNKPYKDACLMYMLWILSDSGRSYMNDVGSL
jgi:hypothetical protein